jgi:hypothetical protein
MSSAYEFSLGFKNNKIRIYRERERERERERKIRDGAEGRYSLNRANN